MSPTRTLMVVFVFGAVALAGCISDDTPTTATEDKEGAANAEVTDTTGSVTGEIASASTIAPLKNAEVSLVQDGAAVAETETDAEGKFTFNGLDPGKYIVQVSALLHRNMARTVTVEASKVATVALMLEPLESTDPFQQGDEYTGMMSFGAEARAHPVKEELAEADAPSGLSMTWGAFDSSHAVNFSIEVMPEYLETIIVEVYWNNEMVGMRSNLWYEPGCEPYCEPKAEYTTGAGFGEIAMRADRPEEGWDLLDKDTEELEIYLWTYSTDEHPVVVAYQQPFTVYWEAWYREPAPEDHVIRTDA